MLKRVMAIAALLVAVPVFAHAWTVNTWVKNGGGNIVVDTNPAQTSVNGSVFKTYADTTDSVSVTVTANTGYTIKAVTVDGTVVTSAAGTGSYPTTLSKGANHSVYATFRANPCAVTTSVTGYGSVTPSALSGILYGQVVKQAIKFTVAPKAGYKVSAVTVPSGVSYVPATSDGLAAHVYIPKDFVFTGPVAITATFAVNATSAQVANAGNAQTLVPPVWGNTATLDGSGSSNMSSYVWTQLSGPATVTLTPTSNGKATFPVPGLPDGTYVFQLAINGISTTPGTDALGRPVPVVSTQIARTTVTINSSATAAAKNICVNCHMQNGVGGGTSSSNTVFNNWSGSVHKANGVLCYKCHSGASTGAHPGTIQCATCHSKAPSVAVITATTVQGGVNTLTNTCAHCHATVDPSDHTLDIHNAQLVTKTGCVDCHDIQIAQHGAGVNDNSGVRAVVPEFTKRSHHILNAGGAAPTNAQCAVCHLEGMSDGNGGIQINTAKHMVDNKIHLRDVDNSASEFAWDGTNHSTMDNFCFGCHDNNGFSDTTTLATLIPAATATNPFNDTLTNGYDMTARAGVMDVKTAFTTTNASHHAVSGQRYQYRFSTQANADEWAARPENAGKPAPTQAEIAEFHVGDASPQGNGTTITAFDADETMEGDFTMGSLTPGEGEATLYEAGKFVATYTPLGATQTVGDNSTLHCGDCHTVGQWKPGSSTSADGSTTTVVIGAHGSNNDYLLRNSLGTDAIHNNLTYVCFNCHKAGTQAATTALWQGKVATGLIADSVIPATGYTNSATPGGVYSYDVKPMPSWKAGWGALHPTVFPGQLTGYAAPHAVSAMHIQCLADSAESVGAANRLNNSWEGDKVKAYDYVGAPGATAALPVAATSTAYIGLAQGSDTLASGNITGIACINCHNSGLRSSFGGIHGGDNTYTDGLGRTQKSYRFMPGMGNYRYAPPGGWDGKDTSDPTLLTISSFQAAGVPGNYQKSNVGYAGPSGKPMGGCYTSGNAAGMPGDTNPGYSSCSHHGTSTVNSVNNIATKPATFRTTYGGGTAATPTAAEPTVREATAGNALVTRPLNY